MKQLKDTLKFSKYTCEDWNGHKTKYEIKETQLYIVYGYDCNADCEFCVYHDKSKKTNIIDLVKLDKMLIDIVNNNISIQMVHITGGEPTLDIDNFTEALKIIRKRLGKIVSISVNTNGINLKQLETLVQQDLLDNIALSRHGITDQENISIFKTQSIAQLEDVKTFNNGNNSMIHVSCNLIKGHVDTPEKIEEFINTVQSAGIIDFGLVQLMNKNKYCVDNYVDFNSLEIALKRKGFVTTQRHVSRENPEDRSSRITCACENYLYTTRDFKMVGVYHRFAIASNSIENYIVYTDGKLRQGFSGEILKEYT